MKTICLAISIILCFAKQAGAQYRRVDIPGSEVREIYSAIVNQQYELHILLPSSYEKSTKKYPVVYQMDSQWDFPLVKSIYGQQYYDGFIPELIIVGITWGGINPKADSLRVRDYTPTNDGWGIQSGGADKFLSFMREELFPFIEKNYRADNKNRTMMGCSLGGLVTLYALFTQPDMFTGHAVASPAIDWDKQVIYQYESKYFEGRNTYPARLYMTIGGVESTVPGFEKFSKLMGDRSYPSLKIKSVVLENTGHSGTKSETYSRGLQYIFERPKLRLDSAILNEYTGVYKSAKGNRMKITNENGQLIFYFSPTYKYTLYAATETDFYSTAAFLKVHFGKGSFRLELFGSTETFTME